MVKLLSCVLIVVGSLAFATAMTGQLGKGRGLAIGLIGSVTLFGLAMTLLHKFGRPKCPACNRLSGVLNPVDDDSYSCPACGHAWKTKSN